MAYSEMEKKEFAWELARSGGNVAAAVKALRTQYESFAEVGESTLRRFLKEDGTADLIAVAAEKLGQLRAEEAVRAEKERMRRELAGTDFDRAARDQSILDELREMFAQRLKEPDAKSDAALLSFYERLTRINDARQFRNLPVLAGAQDCQEFLAAFIAVLARRVPDQSLRGEWIKELREAYVSRQANPKPETSA